MQSLNYDVGGIFVAKNPCSDLSALKTRPVVIISPNNYNNLFEDVVLLGITTKEKDSNISLKITNSELLDASLKQNSYIRVDKPLQLSKEMLQYKITSLTPEALINLKQKIKEFYEL